VDQCKPLVGGARAAYQADAVAPLEQQTHERTGGTRARAWRIMLANVIDCNLIQEARVQTMDANVASITRQALTPRAHRAGESGNWLTSVPKELGKLKAMDSLDVDGNPDFGRVVQA